MDFVLKGILICAKLELKNKIQIIDNNKFILNLEDGNKVEILSYKIVKGR